MRVLIVCSYKPLLPEGCVPFIREQVEAIRDSLNRGLVNGNCKLVNEPLAVEYYYIKGKGVIGYLREIPGMRKKIREWKPDVVHAHYGLSCLVANLAARRVPVVSTYHGSDINVKSVLRFSKIAIRMSAWNIFVSKRNMELAGAVEGKKASLVPCGVELSDDQLQSRAEARKKFGWSTTDKKVLFAGAFDNAVKDPELAKQAMKELKNEGVNAELIELKGYNRHQVNTLMCAVDCLLMTSKTEGSPQVIKEAMACGCPIVSVDVGDVAERTEGVNGCHVVPIDDRLKMIDELAEALKKAIAFEGKTNGREKIIEEGLTNEAVVKKIMAIYESVIK